MKREENSSIVGVAKRGESDDITLDFQQRMELEIKRLNDEQTTFEQSFATCQNSPNELNDAKTLRKHRRSSKSDKERKTKTKEKRLRTEKNTEREKLRAIEAEIKKKKKALKRCQAKEQEESDRERLKYSKNGKIFAKKTKLNGKHRDRIVNTQQSRDELNLLNAKRDSLREDPELLVSAKEVFARNQVRAKVALKAEFERLKAEANRLEALEQRLKQVFEE